MPHECDKLLAALASETWAILPEWLDTIVAVASREYSDTELAKLMREERAEQLAVNRRERTAVIPVYGPIVPRGGMLANVSGIANVEGLHLLLDEAVTDPEIDHVVLDFDSPGGQVTGIFELARHIRDLSTVKPITAYVSGIAGSAAYWLACGASRIVTSPTAKVGSIGVMVLYTDNSIARKAQGLKDHVFISSQSPEKNIDPKTPSGKREIQRHVDATANIFMSEVAYLRNVSDSQVSSDFGKGGMVLAQDAVEIGMVDGIDVMASVLEGDVDRPSGIQNVEGKAMSMQNNPVALAAAGGGKGKPKAEESPKDENKDKPEDDEVEKNTPSSTDETEKEEDDDEETEKAHKKLKAMAPEVWAVAYAAGISSERARLAEIRELGLVGHHDLVEQAMFTKPTNAATLAVACAKADNAARKLLGENRLAEAAEAAVPVAAIALGSSTSEAAEEQAVINAMAGK